ncbi:MAG: ComF family protein [Clostridiales bacterium]|nr:ComF family protein [Clostridiales bacterium]
MAGNFLSELRQLLYPDGLKCIVCGREMRESRYGLCDRCSFDLNGNYCRLCGRHKVGIGDYCGTCSEMSLHFDQARSSVMYSDNAKKTVHRLKYGSAAYLARHLGEFMLDTLFSTDWTFDCFTYVPMYPRKQKKRGYNQAELLAKAVAEHTTTPCMTILEKTVDTPNQARLTREERMKNIAGAFKAVTRPPEHVVLIDDVMTTGSTLSECAKVLKKAGAKNVFALTFASVPEQALTDKQVINIRDFRR